MSEAADLKSYHLQLQQVEAALTSDPDNQELIALKADLVQVIELTQELIDQQRSSVEASSSSSLDPEGAAGASSEATESKKKVRPHDHITPIKHWQVGEQCQAIWEKDGQ